MTASVFLTDDKSIIRRNILSLIIPVVLENMLSMLAGFVTASMLGHLDDFGLSSTTAVSAQGMAVQISNIVWHLFKGLSVGGTIMIAQAYGREDEIRIQNISRTLLKILIIFSIPTSLILNFWGEALMQKFYNPSPEILEASVDYMKITILGFPALAIMLCNTGIFQGRADTKTPMILTFIYNLVNIGFALPLVLGMFTGRPYGTTGAAWSLVIAQYVTALIGFIIMRRPNGILNLETISVDSINPTITFEGVGDICRRGIPTSLENIFWQVSAIVMGSIFMSFGSTVNTANQLGLQAEAMVDMPAIGFGIASTTLAGRLIGARAGELGKEYTKQLINMAIIVMTIGSIILIFLPEQLMGLLTSNEEVIKLGSKYVRIMGFIQIPQNLQNIYKGLLKGAGKTIWPMIISFVGIWCIRIPLSIVIWKLTAWPIWTIWLVVAADQLSRFFISLVVYLRLNIWNNIDEVADNIEQIEAEINEELDKMSS